jgi:hypothetical protein
MSNKLKCPRCSAIGKREYCRRPDFRFVIGGPVPIGNSVAYGCGSRLFDDGEFLQTSYCRLTAENKRLREELAEAKQLASYQAAVEWREKYMAAEKAAKENQP